LRGDNIVHCKKKCSYEGVSNSELLPRSVSISRRNTARFLFVGFDEGWYLQKKRGYMRRITRSNFDFYCPHKEMWRSNKKKNTRPSRARCKTHWLWRWDFRTFIV